MKSPVDQPKNNKRAHRDSKPVATRYFQGKLGCQRCANSFEVRDLNEHRKVIGCPICGELNDVQEAKRRGLTGAAA